jgi:hypothetical protein
MTGKPVTPNALSVLADIAASKARAADIARLLNVPGKSLRQRVRDGRVPDPASKRDDGKFDALPRVLVSAEGTSALTEAHKRGLVIAYVRDDEHAQAILDGLDA